MSPDNLVIIGLVFVAITLFLSYSIHDDISKTGQSTDLFQSIQWIWKYLTNSTQSTQIESEPTPPLPSPIPVPSQPSQPTQKEEVYNIDENEFTYDEARSVCKAYGGRLATYAEVKDAQKNGANWCNYGWTENQMATYPIQKTYWESIQNDPMLKDSCGKPGVNGGYFQDKSLKFGANCWGIKPNPDPSKIIYDENGNVINSTEPTISAIDVFKQKIENGEIEVRPFSQNEWSQYSFKRSSYMLSPNPGKTIQVEETPTDSEKDPRNLVDDKAIV
jgi:hypothetical protein